MTGVAARVIDSMSAPIARGPEPIELGGLGTFPPPKFNPVDFSRLSQRVDWPARAFDVTHVTLFSSRTLPAGPEYTVRARAALRSSE